MPRHALATQSGEGRSRALNPERLINFYAEQAPPSSISPIVLHPVPGLVSWASLGPGPVRALHNLDGRIFAVSGATLYEIDSTGTATSRGNVGASGDCWMEDNGATLFVVSGTTLHTYAGGTLATLAVPFSSTGSLAYLNGRILTHVPGAAQMWASDLNSASFNALSFASAESTPGPILRAIVDHGEYWVFKQEAIEVWYDSGAAGFPLSRSTVIDRGLLAPMSAVGFDNSLLWLADDGIVYRAAGYQPQRVSTHAIEQWISGLTTPEALTGFVMDWQGHKFYVLTGSAGSRIYDAATGLWHERQSYDLPRWRASCHVRAYSKDLVGDAYTGDLWRLDAATYAEGSEPLVSQIVTPPIHADGRRICLDRVQLDLETGTTTAGTETQVVLERSRNRGHTWLPPQAPTRSAGGQGDYGARAVWWRHGQATSHTLRFTISDPAPRSTYALYYEATAVGY